MVCKPPATATGTGAGTGTGSGTAAAAADVAATSVSENLIMKGDKIKIINTGCTKSKQKGKKLEIDFSALYILIF